MTSINIMPDYNETNDQDQGGNGPRGLGEVAREIATAARQLSGTPTPTQSRLSVMGLQAWNDALEVGGVDIGDIKALCSFKKVFGESDSSAADDFFEELNALHVSKLNNVVSSAKRQVAESIAGKSDEHHDSRVQANADLQNLMGEMQEIAEKVEDNLGDSTASGKGSKSSVIDLKVKREMMLYDQRVEACINYVTMREKESKEIEIINLKILSECSEPAMKRLQTRRDTVISMHKWSNRWQQRCGCGRG